MGKILNALKTANGDIPELVLQCLDDEREAPQARPAETRQAGGRRVGIAPVLEPIFEKPPVVRLPQREPSYDDWHPPRRLGRIRLRRRRSRVLPTRSPWPQGKFPSGYRIRVPSCRPSAKTGGPPSNTESFAPEFFTTFRDRRSR